MCLELKNSYVDVFNPSKAPAKAEPVLLAETIPSMPAQGNFFVPAPMPVSNDASNVSVEQTTVIWINMFQPLEFIKNVEETRDNFKKYSNW